MTINKNRTAKYIGTAFVFLVTSCSLPSYLKKTENKNVPAAYSTSASQDTVNTASIKWKDFFKDQNLELLIDEALKNNQELNITLQEVNIAKNEVRARKAVYLPFFGIQAGGGVERSARYTRNGAVDDALNITPSTKIPEPFPDMLLGVAASWEVDIWKKLRNSKKAAMYRYLSSVEGKNFMVTHLVSEIANSYYELLALDNQLDIVKKNIEIQSNALGIVKQEKEATRVTELAVRKFEAEVFHTRSLQFDIQQQIVETENRINFLVGRFPQPVQRNSQPLIDLVVDTVSSGIPSQLLQNRPDIHQAEQQLAAAKLDVKSARAQFYPSLNIDAGTGFNAFNPKYFIKPESILYSLAGGLMMPLINRNAIKAEYYSASARQVQAAYNYERAVLNAYIEVVNQLSNVSNLKNSYDLKSKQVDALNQSISISAGLFRSARADYMEILMTQRDALQSKFELVETKREQMNAMVNIYRALGGGWR